MDNTKEIRCLSLCTGYAGIELGLKRVIPSLRTVAYVEVEAFAVANLVAKIEEGKLDVAPIWTDIKTFNGKPFRNRIHIIIGGYPCQPFSVAGKRKGTDDPRHLWPDIERIIQAVRPIWCFFENVSGHLTLGFPSVYRSLRNLGYSVEAGLFTAAECGAPHRRERLFVLAHSCGATSGNQNGQTCGGFGQENVPQGNGQAGSVRAGATSELADTTAEGLHKGNINQKGQITRYCQNWPARPGQPQYEWEKPRVVADTSCNRKKKRHNSNTKSRNNQEIQPMRNSKDKKNKSTNIDEKGERRAQPRLGRAVNGPASRVDRLRLLGNGVVPQCAEKAFRYLMEVMV